MADLIVSADIVTMMSAANFAGIRSTLSLTSLATTTPGTGVATALAVNIGSAGAPVLFNGAGGTPSAIVLTNATGTAAGLTAGTASAVAVGGITGLGTGVATALAVNVGSAGAPVVLNGAGGTPSSLTLTNATGLPTAGIVDDAVTLAKIANAAANSKLVGSGAAGAGANYVEITLGTGLSMSGTTLNSTAFDQAGNYTLTGTWDFSAATVTFGTVSITTINATSIVFEGSTPDAFETIVGVTNPTADRAIDFPDASGDVVLTSSGVLLSNITLGESTGNILLDNALSADGTWSGITVSGTAGATLAFGDLCYFAAADSRWELADASAASTSGTVMLGICVLAAAADGNATTMLLQGMVRADVAFPTFTISAPVYASETTGDVTGTAPTTTDSVTRVMGFGFTADTLYFCPAPIYQTNV